MNGRGSWALLQQPRLCGLSASARSRVTLHKMLVQFSELVFVVALNVKSAPPSLRIQPAQPPLRMSSAFPNAGGELELELIQSHMAQKPVLRGEVGRR